MKKLLLLLLLLPTIAIAKPYFVWNASPSTDVDGYIVYYTEGLAPTDMAGYNYHCKVSTTECLIEDLNLIPGVEYSVTVTAYNTAGESGPSNVIQYTQPVFSAPDDLKPIDIKINGTITIQIRQE